MALLVVAMFTIFIGLAALVVDRGLAADSQRQAQSAADASALAVAVTLAAGGRPSDADQAARDYAAANYKVQAGDWTACSTPLQAGFVAMTNTSCISYNAGTKSVRVTLPPRSVSSVFGGLFGVSRRIVAGAATARYGPTGISDCVLCILGRLDGQTGGIQVSGGNVVGNQIDFNNANGSIEVTGGDIGYVTSYETSATYKKDGNPTTPQKVTALVDPYGGLPLPPLGTAVATSGSGDCTPGNYTDVGNCATFAPGIYVITEDNKKNALPVSAAGVMFFFTCSDPSGRPKYCAAGGKGGSFEAAGKNTLTLSGLADATSPYNNFAIFVDPHNTTQHKWAGKATLVVTGIVYDPDTSATGGFSDRGNGQLTVNGRAVLGHLELKGQGSDKVHVNVTGPAPAGGTPAVKAGPPQLSQ